MKARAPASELPFCSQRKGQRAGDACPELERGGAVTRQLHEHPFLLRTPSRSRGSNTASDQWLPHVPALPGSPGHVTRAHSRPICSVNCTAPGGTPRQVWAFLMWTWVCTPPNPALRAPAQGHSRGRECSLPVHGPCDAHPNVDMESMLEDLSIAGHASRL